MLCVSVGIDHPADTPSITNEENDERMSIIGPTRTARSSSVTAELTTHADGTIQFISGDIIGTITPYQHQGRTFFRWQGANRRTGAQARRLALRSRAHAENNLLSVLGLTRGAAVNHTAQRSPIS